MAMYESHRPFIQENSVGRALEAMRAGGALHDHPLKYFLCVLERLETPDMPSGDSALEVAVFDLLSEIITRSLERIRRHHGIPCPDGSFVEADLQADFQQDNTDLEAWSLLYHRYVCAERGLTVRRLAAQVHHEERTGRRRLKLGLTRLTHTLIRLERQYRCRDRMLRQRLALPHTRSPMLFGVDDLLATGERFLDEGDPPRHLVLRGPAGIGKTTLALALAHKLVERGYLDDVLWLHVPEMPTAPDALAQEIVARLKFPPHPDASPTQVLRAYLLTHPVLIVLDAADDLLRGDPDRVVQVSTLLEPARVLITSRVAPPDRVWAYQITLPGLDREAAFAMVEYLAGRTPVDSMAWVDHFDALWKAAGGNPQALGLFFGASARLPLTEVLALKTEELYGRIWDQLSPVLRRVWLLALLFPHDGMPYEIVHSLVELDRVAIDQALDGLVSLALLTAYREKNVVYYALQSAALSFLLEHVQRGLEITAHETAAGFLQRAFRRRIRHVVLDAETAASLLLRLASQIGLDQLEIWQFTFELAAKITGANLWQTWLQQLGALDPARCTPGQRAWIYWSIGTALRWVGQLDQAAAYLQRAQSLYQPETITYADVLIELSVVSRYRGSSDEAQEYAQAAMLIYRHFETMGGVERCIHELAQLALDRGDSGEALRWLSGLEGRSARTWGIASQANLNLGQLDEALQAARQAVKLLPIRHPHQGRGVVALAQVYDALGDFDAAVEHLLTAVDLLERAKDTIGAARTYNNLAVVYLRQPADRRAIPYEQIRGLLLKALTIQEHIGDEAGRAITQRNLLWLDDLSVG